LEARPFAAAGSGGSEHQAVGAVPQPTDKTHGGSHRLGEVSEESSMAGIFGIKKCSPDEFFNIHVLYHSRWRELRDWFYSLELSTHCAHCDVT
jgi:hypothetical protein